MDIFCEGVKFSQVVEIQKFLHKCSAFFSVFKMVEKSFGDIFCHFCVVLTFLHFDVVVGVQEEFGCVIVTIVLVMSECEHRNIDFFSIFDSLQCKHIWGANHDVPSRSGVF